MSYKLRYFGVKGRGEAIRYIFALTGQEYVDERIEYEEADYEHGREWQEVKTNTIWGTLPELEYDGHRMCQTWAIVRFLGVKFGLAGNSEWDKAYIDMLMNCVTDITVVYAEAFLSPNKEEMLKEKSPVLHDWVRRFNAFLVANNDGNGWLVGATVSIADVCAYSFIPFLTMAYPNIFDDLPKLQAFFKRFEEIPQIADWIAKRPNTT